MSDKLDSKVKGIIRDREGLRNDKRVDRSRRHGNPKSVRTKHQSLKTCGTETDRTEIGHRHTHDQRWRLQQHLSTINRTARHNNQQGRRKNQHHEKPTRKGTLEKNRHVENASKRKSVTLIHQPCTLRMSRLSSPQCLQTQSVLGWKRSESSTAKDPQSSFSLLCSPVSSQR